MRTPNIGMPIETAVWLTGTEPQTYLDLWREQCTNELGRFALANGVALTAPEWTEKRPGEDRVPPVPAHISGPNVRLLVCEARVAGALPPVVVKASGFVHDLDKRDLERLRTITRQAHANIWPRAAILTDAECDDVIERMGPEIAVKTLRGGVDSKGLH